MQPNKGVEEDLSKKIVKEHKNNGKMGLRHTQQAENAHNEPEVMFYLFFSQSKRHLS